VGKLQRLIAGVCSASFLVCGIAKGAAFPTPPQSAGTREELVKHFGTRIGFGGVEKWEFTTAGRELIVFGYCPYSGRAACYLHVYYHSSNRRGWVLWIDRLLEPATGLSAEIVDRSLIFKDSNGKVVVKELIESLPK
jgi:hypothetical protein